MKSFWFVLLTLCSGIALSGEGEWDYFNYKNDLLSSTIRPDSNKLISFGLKCSKYSKGQINLFATTRFAPTFPRKGKEGVTPVTVEIDGTTLRFSLINHAYFPERIETNHAINQDVINKLINGKELMFFWERSSGRLELEVLSLKNSSVAIAKLQVECKKI
jgi:hypothetical protein